MIKRSLIGALLVVSYYCPRAYAERWVPYPVITNNSGEVLMVNYYDPESIRRSGSQMYVVTTSNTPGLYGIIHKIDWEIDCQKNRMRLIGIAEIDSDNFIPNPGSPIPRWLGDNHPIAKFFCDLPH